MVVKAWQVRAKVLRSRSFSLSYLKNYLVSAIKGTVKDPELYEVHDFPGAREDYLEVLQKTASEAMFQLGILYTKDLKDSENAEKFLRMASETGHVRAMIYLADLYNYTNQDYQKAEEYYHMAANTNDLYALVNLGFLYHDKLKNYKKAEQYYLIAAERGDVSAMNGLAWLYFEQRRAKQQALHYAQKTLELENNIHTAHTAACIYLWNNQQEQAFQLAEKFMYAPEAYKALEKDILFYLMLVLAKQHYYQVMSYFRAFELRLQERFQPLYYALLYFIGNPNYHKLPPELSEIVEDIIRQINQMALEYA
jgi:TPR repeat protein